MKKIVLLILSTLILPVSYAQYTIKTPLESISGGSLPNNSIIFTNSSQEGNNNNQQEGKICKYEQVFSEEKGIYMWLSGSGSRQTVAYAAKESDLETGEGVMVYIDRDAGDEYVSGNYKYSKGKFVSSELDGYFLYHEICRESI